MAYFQMIGLSLSQPGCTSGVVWPCAWVAAAAAPDYIGVFFLGGWVETWKHTIRCAWNRPFKTLGHLAVLSDCSVWRHLGCGLACLWKFDCLAHRTKQGWKPQLHVLECQTPHFYIPLHLVGVTWFCFPLTPLKVKLSKAPANHQD